MKIILASKSLRRIELLKEITKDFDIYPASKKEVFDSSIDLDDAMISLSYQKAKEVFDKYPDACVIGSDTLVFLNNKPIHKPKDIHEAASSLKAMRNKTHVVITSVSILYKDQNISFTDKTYVTFKDFSDSDLKEFLDSNEWEGKSGAYAIQSLDDRYIKSIDGDINTVIGFPVKRVKKALDQLKII